jgi:hypothetical protein
MTQLNNLRSSLYIALGLLGGLPLYGMVFTINEGSGHAIDITSVVYNYNDTLVTQTSPASGANTATYDAVYVTDMQINDGGIKNLKFFNEGQAYIRVNNLGSVTGSLGVYRSNGLAKVQLDTDGVSAYEAAVIESSTNTDLMNYLYYDGNISGMPEPGVHDFDLIYQYGWTVDDYLVVAERNGNTNFELQALDEFGQVIDGADTLKFDATYGWETGYENTVDSNNGQDMWFSAASVTKFFEGTSIAVEDQVVFGYRIDNNGNADVKFFGASDDTFTNNPTSLVPEPALLPLVLGAVALLFVGGRRQR